MSKIRISRQNVATREGGVDRNIPPANTTQATRAVATREGGVDRNVLEYSDGHRETSRHPRGWRG